MSCRDPARSRGKLDPDFRSNRCKNHCRKLRMAFARVGDSRAIEYWYEIEPWVCRWRNHSVGCLGHQSPPKAQCPVVNSQAVIENTSCLAIPLVPSDRPCKTRSESLSNIGHKTILRALADVQDTIRAGHVPILGYPRSFVFLPHTPLVSKLHRLVLCFKCHMCAAPSNILDLFRVHLISSLQNKLGNAQTYCFLGCTFTATALLPGKNDVNGPLIVSTECCESALDEPWRLPSVPALPRSVIL
jgi:hypothetical protein